MSQRPMPGPMLLYLSVFALALFTIGALSSLVILIQTEVWGRTETWGDCVLSFQLIGLAGCVYAYVSSRVFDDLRRQALLHCCVAAMPLLWRSLPLALVLNGWGLTNDSREVRWVTVLTLMLLHVGPAVFVLTASAPLLLRWFAASRPPNVADTYVLYAICGLGALTALIVHPIFIRPWLAARDHDTWWKYGYAVAVALIFLAGLLLWLGPVMFGSGPANHRENEAANPSYPRPATGTTVWRRLRWLALAALVGSLVAGQANYVSTEVSAIPLIWVIPLTLSALALIIAFTRQPLLDRLPRWTRLGLHLAHGAAILISFSALLLTGQFPGALSADWCAPLLTVLYALLLLMPHSWVFVAQPLLTLVLLTGFLTPCPIPFGWIMHLLGAYLATRLCHGELAATRPPIEEIPAYFVWIALGSVLGWFYSVLFLPSLSAPVLLDYALPLVLVCLFRPGRAGPGRPERLAVSAFKSLFRYRVSNESRGQRIAGIALAWLWLLVVGTVAALTAPPHNNGARLNERQFFVHPARPEAAPWLLFGMSLLLCLVVVRRPVLFGLSLGVVLLIGLNGSTGHLVTASGLVSIPAGAFERVAITLVLTPAFVGAAVVLAGVASGLGMLLAGMAEDGPTDR